MSVLGKATTALFLGDRNVVIEHRNTCLARNFGAVLQADNRMYSWQLVNGTAAGGPLPGRLSAPPASESSSCNPLKP